MADMKGLVVGLQGVTVNPKPPILTRVVPSQPRVSQLSSRLMTLSAETRLIVLRHLLVSDRPISSRESYPDPYLCLAGKGRRRGTGRRDERGRFVKEPPREPVSGYRLTPSILRTCQQLCSEALPLLYHENVLQLQLCTVHSFERAEPSSCLVNSTGLFWTNHIAAFTQGINDEHPLRYNKDTGRSIPRKSLASCLARVVRRFRNLLIVTSYNVDEFHLVQLRNLLRPIASICQATNIQVEIKYPPTVQTKFPERLIRPEIRTLGAFKLLRCSSFEFANIVHPMGTQVQKIITGSDTVLDLEEFLPTTGIMLHSMYNSTVRSKHPGKIEALMGKLLEAVLDADVDSFLDTRLFTMVMWWKFVGSGPQVIVDINVPRCNSFCLEEDLELGFEVKEDGKATNAKLRDLVQQSNYSGLYYEKHQRWTMSRGHKFAA